MRKNSIADNFARKQMRHQTVRQTDGYTDEAQLPIYDAIKHLPRLTDLTHIRAQISGVDGQNMSQCVATCGGSNTHRTVVNGGVCPDLAVSVAVENWSERRDSNHGLHFQTVPKCAEVSHFPHDRFSKI